MDASLVDLTECRPCPVCGRGVNAYWFWSHLSASHGVEWWDKRGQLDPLIMVEAFCACGQAFPSESIRLQHFAEHGKECLLIWSLTH